MMLHGPGGCLAGDCMAAASPAGLGREVPRWHIRRDAREEPSPAAVLAARSPGG